MISMQVKNVNDAYHAVLRILKEYGVKSDSRNGKVLTVPVPVGISMMHPQQRVLFDKSRHANPFFHLMEGLWMLAGRKDTTFITQFNKQMAVYSDDGTSLTGAYGFRWRNHFGYDQISVACEMLKTNPLDRRVVISMWDPYSDLGSLSKDVPCNQQAIFRIVNGSLHMLTTNRSNDAVWGLMGANAVHLTMLQEYMASRIGVPMGEWHHVTNNLHIYEHHWPLLESEEHDLEYPDIAPIVWSAEFDEDCNDLCNGRGTGFSTEFFEHTVRPMLAAWYFWKGERHNECLVCLDNVRADDWRVAARNWIHNSLEKRT